MSIGAYMSFIPKSVSPWAGGQVMAWHTAGGARHPSETLGSVNRVAGA